MNFETIVMMVCIVGSVHMLTPLPPGDKLKLVPKFRALERPVQSISLINGPLIVVGLGPFPSIIAGISDLVAIIAVNANMRGVAAYDLEEISKCKLMNMLTGKAGLFQQVPLIGAPVAAALRALESAIDAMITGKNEEPTELQRGQLEAFRGCVENAINAYEGLNI